MTEEQAARPRLDSFKSSSSSMNGSRQWIPRVASPSFSETTTASNMQIGPGITLITRKDLRQSIASFDELMQAAKTYRNAVLAMSTATAAFATVMEACSRVKGCNHANAGLAGAAGLQFLIANHEQILADSFYRQFEIPLLEALDAYRANVAERLNVYEKALHEQSQRIRKTESDNVKLGRKRTRDLQSFRRALAELQRQVDELDALKAEYHDEVLEGEDEMWDTVLSKTAFVVRSQLDLYDKISSKSTDPTLEPLIASIPDPFESYPQREEGQIFSVLAPLGLTDKPTPYLSRSNSYIGNGVSEEKWEGEGRDDGTEVEEEGRKRRELSVIEERERSDCADGGEELGGVAEGPEAEGDLHVGREDVAQKDKAEAVDVADGRRDLKGGARDATPEAKAEGSDTAERPTLGIGAVLEAAANTTLDPVDSEQVAEQAK